MLRKLVAGCLAAAALVPALAHGVLQVSGIEEAQGRLRHRIDYVSNEHLADSSGARQRKIDVQTPTKVPVRVLANRPRCVRELKYIQRSTPRRVRATRRSSTCILAAVYLCCLLFCFLFSDGHGRPTEILRYWF